MDIISQFDELQKLVSSQCWHSLDGLRQHLSYEMLKHLEDQCKRKEQETRQSPLGYNMGMTARWERATSPIVIKEGWIPWIWDGKPIRCPAP